MSAPPLDPGAPLDLNADEPIEDGRLTFNGVNGSTGEYLLPPETVAELFAEITARPAVDPEHTADLQARMQDGEPSFAARVGVDERDLAQAGWGVIFARDADPAIRAALRPLLDHRRAQAARVAEGRYREFIGPDGYRPGETKNQFITRHGSAPGPVDPDRIPYYLLIVGDPEAIPYVFQAQLDVPHAVGRIHFATVQEYADYARTIVTAETAPPAPPAGPRRATFFGVRNPGDQATALSARYLVGPLAQNVARQRPAWAVQTIDGPAASKAQLASLLGGAETPDLLFTASHGVGFNNGDPRQLSDQGALLCGDWPGPFGTPAGQPLSRDHYLAARDIPDDAALRGLVAFHFACYGAGTPRFDEFAHRARMNGAATATAGTTAAPPAEIAPHAFLAGLPQRLLGHPAGGALAVVGHVERAWGCSFLWGGRRVEQIAAFEDALLLLIDGYPLGAALEALNQRYAECATTLGEQLERVSFGLPVDQQGLVALWTANNDARGYAVIGDPAVRLVRPPAVASPADDVPITLTPRSPDPSSTPPVLPLSRKRERGLGGEGEPLVEFGRPGLDSLEQVRTQIGAALERLGGQLAAALGDAATLTVTTYTGADLADAVTGTGPVAGATPAVVTRIGLLGDLDVFLPSQAGAVDAVTWARHMDNVGGAQAQRAALLAAAAETAAALARLLRPI